MKKITPYFIQRSLEPKLLEWKNHQSRMPLLVRGARQVGKTSLIEQFGMNHFDSMVQLNLEKGRDLFTSFESLDPHAIIQAISLFMGQSIKPGETLLFIDEIQECPAAIQALRYFKEQMPELHIIGAGSLLELTLNQDEFRMPVGRVQSLYLKPLSFHEFLTAVKEPQLVNYLKQVSLNEKIDPAVHSKLLSLVKKYCLLGGMPAVVNHYLKSSDFLQCQELQGNLLSNYYNDFSKYHKKINRQVLQLIFNNVPRLVGEHFKYVKIDAGLNARELKPALDALAEAGLVYKVYCSKASGLPLNSLINLRKFKLLFLDIGLVSKMTQLGAQVLLQDDILLINRGALAEQFVGQELLAYANSSEQVDLFYWEREKVSSQAEVDYVVNFGKNIIPLEVKSGATGRLRSLQIFIEEKSSSLGVCVSQKPMSWQKPILSLPLYLISELPRLMSEVA